MVRIIQKIDTDRFFILPIPFFQSVQSVSDKHTDQLKKRSSFPDILPYRENKQMLNI